MDTQIRPLKSKAMQISLILVERASGKSIEVHPDMLLGRLNLEEVGVKDSKISSRHCSLRYDEVEGSIIVKDLNSTNGTAINGKVLAPGFDHKLHPGGKLQIGNTVFVLRYEDEQVEASQKNETRKFINPITWHPFTWVLNFCFFGFLFLYSLGVAIMYPKINSEVFSRDALLTVGLGAAWLLGIIPLRYFWKAFNTKRSIWVATKNIWRGLFWYTVAFFIFSSYNPWMDKLNAGTIQALCTENTLNPKCQSFLKATNMSKKAESSKNKILEFIPLEKRAHFEAILFRPNESI